MTVMVLLVERYLAFFHPTLHLKYDISSIYSFYRIFVEASHHLDQCWSDSLDVCPSQVPSL